MLVYWILASATVLLVVATLLPLWRSPHWCIRGLDFPRVQLAVLGTVLLTAELLWLRPRDGSAWVLLGATAAACGYHLLWIWPYTPLARREVRPATAHARGPRLKLLAANVLMTNRRAAEFLRLVRIWQPDVIVTLETDRWWERQLAELETAYPHRLNCPLENLYGMHLFSRLPLVNSKIQYLVEDDKPSMHTLVRLPGGWHVQLHCLHPAPPSPTENSTSSERDAELVMVGRAVAQEPMPVLVTGDLNDVAWSATTRLFRKLSGLLDPRIGRGPFSTYHTRYPLLRWPLDHFFHSRHFTLVRLERLPAFGSDHFPMFVELALGDPAVGEQADEGLVADADDREEAREMTAAEGVSPRAVHCPRVRREPTRAKRDQGRSP